MGFLNFNYIHCMKARLSYQKLYFRTGTHISSSIRVKKKKRRIFKSSLGIAWRKKLEALRIANMQEN